MHAGRIQVPRPGARNAIGISALSPGEFATWVRKHDVLFVAGVYKTGTSLAVNLCVKAGCSDPSRETNPGERGYGNSISRYLTRECKVLRQVNEGLLRRDDRVVTVGRPSPEHYLLEWGCPVVLKDPRFVFTLQRWIVAVRRLGRRPGVIFSDRSRDELITAWEIAPFTRRLLMQDQFRTYLVSFQEGLAWCVGNSVSHIVISLDELRRINGACPCRQPVPLE